MTEIEREMTSHSVLCEAVSLAEAIREGHKLNRSEISDLIEARAIIDNLLNLAAWRDEFTGEAA